MVFDVNNRLCQQLVSQPTPDLVVIECVQTSKLTANDSVNSIPIEICLTG